MKRIMTPEKERQMRECDKLWAISNSAWHILDGDETYAEVLKIHSGKDYSDSFITKVNEKLTSSLSRPENKGKIITGFND